jgi:hypothetical protein
VTWIWRDILKYSNYQYLDNFKFFGRKVDEEIFAKNTAKIAGKNLTDINPNPANVESKMSS